MSARWQDEPCEAGTVKSLSVNKDTGRVTGITLDTSIGCGWPHDAEADPVIGDHVRIIGPFGRPFYGMAINGRLVWWLTPEQREEKQQRALADIRSRREQNFIDNEARLDEQYEALPPVFRQRIRQLRERGGRDWRVEGESYEMFVCTEAVKIAEHFGTAEEIQRWYALPYKEQKAEWDGFDAGHSGNTFGAACHYAALYAQNPHSERLVATPQAISPLAGDPRYSE